MALPVLPGIGGAGAPPAPGQRAPQSYFQGINWQ